MAVACSERSLAISRRDACHRPVTQYGAVFYVEEFKKIDEETGGRIKYLCEHRVIGAARIKRILNPRNLKDRSTYVRAVVEDVNMDLVCEPYARVNGHGGSRGFTSLRGEGGGGIDRASENGGVQEKGSIDRTVNQLS